MSYDECDYTDARAEANFWAKVDKSGECWQWQGHTDRRGYGCFTVMRGVVHKTFRAHRLAYQFTVGSIPDGLVLDHLCKNTGCVNPSHLEPVTQRENVLRSDGIPAVNAAKTECVNGHAFTPENTIQRAHGWRGCRECARAYDRRTRAAKKQGKVSQ